MEELERRGLSVRALAKPEDCLRCLHEQDCHLLVVDIDGDAAVGLEALRASYRAAPHLPQLVLVPHGDIAAAVMAMKTGATECLEKPIKSDRLRSTLETILNRSHSVAPRRQTVLTRMERLVLRHILKGKTSQEIAAILNRSPRTVEVHRRNLMRKLGVSNVVQLVKGVGRIPTSPTSRCHSAKSRGASHS
jgi:two-component system response regulator TtrR